MLNFTQLRVETFQCSFTRKPGKFCTPVNNYKKCSSRQFIKNITKPTLILHAIDDPFMTEDVIPDEDELSSSVTMELCHGGGHVGFIDGSLP